MEELNEELLLTATATFCSLIAAFAVIYANTRFSPGVFRSSVTILSVALVFMLYAGLLNLLELFYPQFEPIVLPMRLVVFVLTSILFLLFSRKLVEMSDLFGVAKPSSPASSEKEQGKQI